MPVRAAVGFGSNLGDSAGAIARAAIDLAKAAGVRCVARSSLYRSAPLGPPQPEYVNAVGLYEVQLAPEKFLDLLLEIELSMGRTRGERWGPRTIDLDLLSWGELVLESPRLSLPHPGIHLRSFVLAPLAEVAPGWVHPVLGRTPAAMMAALRESGKWTRVEPLTMHTKKILRLIETKESLRDWVRTARASGSTIGFVPTMGALHAGHLSLARRAKAECGLAIVSIYVNPLQFGPNEDFDRYPRDLPRDMELLSEVDVDAVFHITNDRMYAADHTTYVLDEDLTRGLCGASRPGHFRGVTTVVTKLFNLVTPNRAYFGQKDAQQVAVIRRMVRDLDFGIDVVVCETVREPGGLAMSSRNVHLSTDQRKRALVLYRSLERARELVERGSRDAAAIASEMRSLQEREPGVKVEYIEIVDPESLERVRTVARTVLVAVAAFVGKTRLIDNALITPPTSYTP